MKLTEIKNKMFLKKDQSELLFAVVCWTSKRVTNGGAHLRSLGPGQYTASKFEKTLQRRRAAGNTVSN